MGLFDAIGAVASNSLADELRQLRKVIEIGIDSQREIAGLPPVFVEVEPAPPMMTPSPGVIPSGDFQTYYVLEQLAREHGIPLTTDLDLEALALERGWMSPEGNVLILPKEP